MPQHFCTYALAKFPASPSTNHESETASRGRSKTPNHKLANASAKLARDSTHLGPSVGSTIKTSFENITVALAKEKPLVFDGAIEFGKKINRVCSAGYGFPK